MKREATFAAVTLSLAVAPSFGQFIYQRSLGTPTSNEIGYGIDHVPAGGFVMAGARQGIDSSLPQDAYVTRVREDGNTIWLRQIGVVNVNDAAYSVQALSDGTFIVAGETQVTIPPSAAQIFLMRLNSLGNIMWSFRYGGTAFQDFPSGVSVREVPDRGFVAVGRRTGLTNDPMVGVMIGVDAAGAPVFQKQFSARFSPSVNFGVLSLSDVRVLATGYLAVGWVDNRQVGGTLCPILIRTDLGGNLLWNRIYPITGLDIWGDGLDIDRNGDVVFSARFTNVTNPNATGTIVCRVDSNGIPMWTQLYRDFRDGVAGVEISDLTSRIVVAGTLRDPASTAGLTDAALVKLEPSGAPIFQVHYGSVQTIETGHGVIEAPCGRGYALTGSDRLVGNVGLQDEYLVRTLPTGRSGCLEGPFSPPTFITVQPDEMIVRDADQQEFASYQPVNQFLGTNIAHCSSSTCVADMDDGSGLGEGDDGVTIDDLIYFLALYEAGLPCADVDDGSGTGTPDGGITIDDLIYFLTRFEAGC